MGLHGSGSLSSGGWRKMTDWNGKELGINSDGKIIASNFSNHHKEVISLLKKNI